MKTGIIGPLLLGNIRTRLEFCIPMLAPPSDQIQNMFDRERRIAYMMLPMRGKFHRLESPDAVDLLSTGKRFQNDFGGEDGGRVEVEAVAT
jgi:hypothetical protein